MTQNLQELYYLVNDEISRNCMYREKLKVLAEVKVMLSKELEEYCKSSEPAAMLEVYHMMEAERQELHSHALFEAALQLGIELGRL